MKKNLVIKAGDKLRYELFDSQNDISSFCDTTINQVEASGPGSTILINLSDGVELYCHPDINAWAVPWSTAQVCYIYINDKLVYEKG